MLGSCSPGAGAAYAGLGGGGCLRGGVDLEIGLDGFFDHTGLVIDWQAPKSGPGNEGHWHRENPISMRINHRNRELPATTEWRGTCLCQRAALCFARWHRQIE